jgi:hypothetical protein
MNIQDLIARLAAIKEEHGNLPVIVCDHDGVFGEPSIRWFFVEPQHEKKVVITNGSVLFV